MIHNAAPKLRQNRIKCSSLRFKCNSLLHLNRGLSGSAVYDLSTVRQQDHIWWAFNFYQPYFQRHYFRGNDVPDGAAYLTRTFACEAGSRDFKLYILSHMDGRKLPLIICGTYITDGKVCPPFSFIG